MDGQSVLVTASLKITKSVSLRSLFMMLVWCVYAIITQLSHRVRTWSEPEGQSYPEVDTYQPMWQF